jgi:hypothetical protein
LAYAGDEANHALGIKPTVAVYEKANIVLDPPLGLTAVEMVESVNSVLASGPVTESSMTNAAGIQAVVDSYRTILSAATTGNLQLTLTVDKYDLLGLTVDTDAAALLNSVLSSKSVLEVDTWKELDALASVATRVLATANDAEVTPALKAADLKALGLSGVTADNLDAVLAAIAAKSAADVDTLSELAVVTNAGVSSFNAALSAISAYAGNATTAQVGSAPALASYAALGIALTAPADDLIASVNTVLASLPVESGDVATATQIKAIVEAYDAIRSADATNTNTPALNLSQAAYTVLGLDEAVDFSLNGDQKVSLLNSVLDAKSATVANIDTWSELEALATIVDAVIATAAGRDVTPALTASDLSVLGLSNITADNLDAVLAAIVAAGAANVDSLTELNSVTALTVSAFNGALNVIRSYAGDNNAAAGQIVPVLADYAALGIDLTTPADDALVASVNTVLASLPVENSDVTTASQVKAIVAAYDAIRAANNDGNLALNQAAYTALGLDAAVDFSRDGAQKVSLLNSVLDAKAATVAAVDQWAKLKALAEIANAVIDTAAGGRAVSPALTAADLTAIGLDGVTPANLNAVIAKIDALVVSNADSLSKLQAAVDDAISAFYTTLSQIAAYAETNGGSAPTSAPTADDLAMVGVVDPVGKQLTEPLLSAVKSAIAGLDGTDVNNTEKLQAIVDSYALILNWAQSDGANVEPTQADYTTIGIDLKAIDGNPNGLSLLNDILALDSKAANVDTTAELQALVNVVDQLMRQVAGETVSPALSTADFAVIGIDGVTSANLTAILGALAASQDSGLEINSLSRLQAFAAIPVLTIATVAGDNVINKLEKSQPVVLSGAVTNVVDGTLVTIKVMDGSRSMITQTALVQGGKWTLPLGSSALLDQAYNLTVTTQKFGLDYTETTAFTVATTAPKVGITAISGDNKFDANERFSAVRTAAASEIGRASCRERV